MTPRSVDVGSTRLALREWGEPDARAVLCLHKTGAAAGGAQYEAFGPGLAAHGFRVVAPDAPGYGGSPALHAEQYRLRRFADLWLGLLDQLGVGDVAVVGSSWGGAQACHLARAAPERTTSVALLDAGHVDYGTHFGMAELTIEDAELLMADARVAGDGPVTTATLAAVRYALVHDAVSVTWPALRDVPVLLLVAGDPPDARAPEWEQRFATALPGAEVRVLEDWPHDMPGHDGAALANLLGPWLRARA